MADMLRIEPILNYDTHITGNVIGAGVAGKTATSDSDIFKNIPFPVSLSRGRKTLSVQAITLVPAQLLPTLFSPYFPNTWALCGEGWNFARAQLVSSIALQYKITTIPGRGYNSVSQLMALADEFKRIDKSIIVLYFGDFDPTGLDIDRSAGERLSAYSKTDVKLVRMALTEDDIQGLPSNPTKATDPRQQSYVQKYGNRCWELDALPPNELQNRVRTSIKTYVDEAQWQKDKEREQADRVYIDKVVDKIGSLWDGQVSND